MSGLIVAFRTDGGASIGLGHVQRCVTLAQDLQKRGGIARFVVNEDPLVDQFVGKYGFDGVSIDERTDQDLSLTLDHARQWNAEVLVIDSYAVRGECLDDVREPAIVVLDDLATRRLPVDLVVNSAVNARDMRYQPLPRTKLLLGTEYAILRREFGCEPRRPMRERAERVLITVGGCDANALTERLIAWIEEAIGPVAIDVVIGPFFDPVVIRQIEHRARNKDSITLYREPSGMRDLMLTCDFAISGGGQTTYELAASGTPAVAIRLADNQTQNLSGLHEAGVLLWAGDVRDAGLEAVTKRVMEELAAQPARRAELSRHGRALVDGRGTARVSREIVSLAPAL